MTGRLSKREKMLAILVGGTLFLLVNVVVLRLVTRVRADLQGQLQTKQSELAALESLFAESDQWKTRSAWLQANQPKLDNVDEAQVKLLDDVKEIAKKNGVLLENPALGNAEKQPNYQSVPITVETKSSWEALISFLQAIQSPERFMVFENASLKIDPSDQTQMRGSFRIAKWYAP